ncbi:MAG TPA: MFS transporter [Casimicrobiaceae bacterium]
MATKPARRGIAAIPRGVWALGIVSLCMDLSSELIHSLLPLYMAVALGASTFTIGIVEGVAEALALIVKVFSGVLSDVFRKRKSLVVVGYGLAALTKFIFPLASTLGWVVTARFADRVGKGIRGAPRDALIADIAPADVRGASFGLRQALDTVGAIGGPLLALAAMVYFAGNFRASFWVAVIPAVICVVVLIFGVKEPATVGSDNANAQLRLADAKRFPSTYWIVVAIAGVLTLARFSEAFLVLRAQNVGLQVSLVPWVMVIMSTVYAAVAYPTGAAADRGAGAQLLWSGLVALIVADIVLASATTPAGVFVGAALWGLHMGLTQGLLSALVAAAAPADLRGSGFGIFNLVSGVALLIASALAGWLWDAYGPRFTFYAGAVFTAIALIALLARGRKVGSLER